MSIRKREKANDVNLKIEPVFGKRVSFQEAFTCISKIQIEVFEFDGFMRPEDNSYKKKKGSELLFGSNPRFRLYTEKNIPGEFINCSEPLCYDGGFNIVTIIRNMIGEKKNLIEGTEKCQGYLGSPKGRKKYKYCSHEFDYNITIEYKDNNKITN